MSQRNNKRTSTQEPRNDGIFINIIYFEARRYFLFVYFVYLHNSRKYKKNVYNFERTPKKYSRNKT
jgi:hypothetical protein